MGITAKGDLRDPRLFCWPGHCCLLTWLKYKIRTVLNKCEHNRFVQFFESKAVVGDAAPSLVS